MPERTDRSRSPYRSSHSHDHERTHHRRRSRSPTNSKRDSKHSRKDRYEHSNAQAIPKALPLNAVPLSKHALRTHRPLFALYLDVQKQLDIEDLPEDEVKGRWKSFVKKWNAGDLAEGWYDPTTFEKAQRGVFGTGNDTHTKGHRPAREEHVSAPKHDADTDEDEFGPALPTSLQTTTSTNSYHTPGPGPSIPTTTDLRARNEEAHADSSAAQTSHTQAMRASRKAERLTQKERLEELAPRAEPGTRERQLEKKREAAASNRAFASAKEAGGDVEVRDADVMGDEDSLGELKRMKEAEQRKRSEREIRREEMLRARNAEREERVRGMREKEAKTMEMLKSIAKVRFGAGDEG